MLKIRLKRLGRKGDPHFRIVVIRARTKRDGKAAEYIGYYNPKQKSLKLDKERASYWLSVGAQATPTVHSILAKHKLVKPLPRPERAPKKPKKEQETDRPSSQPKAQAVQKERQKQREKKTKDKQKDKPKEPTKEKKEPAGKELSNASNK